MNSRTENIVIQTNRLFLRNITDDDLSNIYKGLSHPEVIKHYGVSFESIEATEEQMRWFKNPSQSWWAICESSSDKFIGAVGFNAISIQHKKAEIGLWLLPEFWGKGYMQEIMPPVCNYGFDHLNLHRIEGFVETENTACRRSMRNVSFTHEGTMKDCEIKDGKFISVEIYSLLADSNKV